VDEFELVSIDDVPALMGVLTEANGVYWLDGSPDVRLGGVPSELARALGGLVWVTGHTEGEDFRIQSFGIIAARR